MKPNAHLFAVGEAAQAAHKHVVQNYAYLWKEENVEGYYEYNCLYYGVIWGKQSVSVFQVVTENGKTVAVYIV